jgi:hypothetical protein
MKSQFILAIALSLLATLPESFAAGEDGGGVGPAGAGGALLGGPLGGPVAGGAAGNGPIGGGAAGGVHTGAGAAGGYPAGGYARTCTTGGGTTSAGGSSGIGGSPFFGNNTGDRTDTASYTGGYGQDYSADDTYVKVGSSAGSWRALSEICGHPQNKYQVRNNHLRDLASAYYIDGTMAPLLREALDSFQQIHPEIQDQESLIKEFLNHLDNCPLY